MKLSEQEFTNHIRKILNDKLDEWFDLIPYDPDLCDTDLISTEVQAALGWIQIELEGKNI